MSEPEGTMKQRIRWSDDDRYFGPFTYVRGGFCPLGVILCSGDDEDYPGCSLRMSGFGHTLIVALPRIIRPWRNWVDTSKREWSSKSGGFWDVHRREYGFSVFEDHLDVCFGPQTGDSSTEKRWGCFLPWTQWRHIRHSFYGVKGEHIATLPDTGQSYLDDPGRWDRERLIEKSVPTVVFSFADYDGEELTATTKIEEREWRRGEGWFKWLSWFYRPKISRSLDIRFSGEVGKRKGSWKGGTIGHAIEMRPNELHEAAFRRYCAEHNLTFNALAGAG